MPSRLKQAMGAKADGPVAGDLAIEGHFSALIAEDASAMNQKVHITFISTAPGMRHGMAARWMPRNDTQTMPKRGDRCIVIIDENQDPWIPVWWPHAYS